MWASKNWREKTPSPNGEPPLGSSYVPRNLTVTLLPDANWTSTGEPTFRWWSFAYLLLVKNPVMPSLPGTLLLPFFQSRGMTCGAFASTALTTWTEPRNFADPARIGETTLTPGFPTRFLPT